MACNVIEGSVVQVGADIRLPHKLGGNLCMKHAAIYSEGTNSPNLINYAELEERGYSRYHYSSEICTFIQPEECRPASVEAQDLCGAGVSPGIENTIQLPLVDQSKPSSEQEAWLSLDSKLKEQTSTPELEQKLIKKEFSTSEKNTVTQELQSEQEFATKGCLGSIRPLRGPAVLGFLSDINDDMDLQAPADRCVDYLSHQWNEPDLWTSWRTVTKEKTRTEKETILCTEDLFEIRNGSPPLCSILQNAVPLDTQRVLHLRLENASWRTWAKKRGNLKTVHPESLNWLKECDVTWLYGPLHCKSTSCTNGNRNNGNGNGKTSSAGKKKAERSVSVRSILKKRPPFDFRPYEVNRRGSISHQQRPDTPRRGSWSASVPLCWRTTVGSLPTIVESPFYQSNENHHSNSIERKEHISFNCVVKQCIAVDSFSEWRNHEYHQDKAHVLVAVEEDGEDEWQQGQHPHWQHKTIRDLPDTELNDSGSGGDAEESNTSDSEIDVDIDKLFRGAKRGLPCDYSDRQIEYADEARRCADSDGYSSSDDEDADYECFPTFAMAQNGNNGYDTPCCKCSHGKDHGTAIGHGSSNSLRVGSSDIGASGSSVPVLQRVNERSKATTVSFPVNVEARDFSSGSSSSGDDDNGSITDSTDDDNSRLC